MRYWPLLFVPAVLVAQTEATKPTQSRIIGEVTSKDAGGGNLTVRSDAGSTYSVTLSEKTLFLRVPPGEKDLKKAARIAAADVSVGDRVIARGAVPEGQKTVPATAVIVMTRSDLAERQKQEQERWRQQGVTGIVQSVDAQTGEIVVAARDREGAATRLTVAVTPETQLRRYAPGSVRFADATPGKLSQIEAGDQVRALGERTGDRIRAEQVVSGSFRTVAGTVVSVDATAGEIHLNDVETKKPVTIRITPDTQLRRLPPMAAAMLARRLNPTGDAGETGRPMPQEGGAERRRAGGAGGRAGDLQMVLERAPQFSLSDLQRGEALIVSTTSAGRDRSAAIAITVLGGVDPILRAAPSGGFNAGAWNMELNMPVQ